MSKHPVIYGMLAEFDSPEAIVEAAQKVAAAGYQHTEAYTPFAVHELPEILGQHRTMVAPICLGCGLLGALLGFGMCWYANVISYPWNIGGRPPDSWPAFIPITFELMVLGASMGAVLGMIGLNGLPEPYHPVFNAPNFVRASKDRFFLCIEARDAKFDPVQTRKFFEELSPLSVTEVPE